MHFSLVEMSCVCAKRLRVTVLVEGRVSYLTALKTSIAFRASLNGRKQPELKCPPPVPFVCCCLCAFYLCRTMTTLSQTKELFRRAEAVCFDVDSTVIREEGIDELAKFCGVGDAVTEMCVSCKYILKITFTMPTACSDYCSCHI